MPLIVNRRSGIMQGTADKDYFLTLEGKVTTDEEKAHSLLIRKGQDIPKDIADKYGIGKKASADAERLQRLRLRRKISRHNRRRTNRPVTA
jgi:hypothetical protein